MKKISKNSTIVIITVLVVLAIAGLSAGVAAVVWNVSHRDSDHSDRRQDPDHSDVQQNDEIDLSELTTDLTITEAGRYVISGETSHSVIIDAEGATVELVLNGVTINQTRTAAIIGKSGKQLTIHLAEDSENTLTDGGVSDYDACIYSNFDLVFDGEGSLKVTGQQEEGEGIATEAANMTFNSGHYEIMSADDGLNAGGNGGTITINGGNIFVIGSDIGGDAGIDTDDGYEINGGTVIALGSDMIEAPLATSKQNTLAITFDEKIASGEQIKLMRGDAEIASFTANKSFKTLIFSSSELVTGEYMLYQGGTQIEMNGTKTLRVETGINEFGKSGASFGPGGPGVIPPEKR